MIIKPWSDILRPSPTTRYTLLRTYIYYILFIPYRRGGDRQKRSNRSTSASSPSVSAQRTSFYLRPTSKESGCRHNWIKNVSGCRKLFVCLSRPSVRLRTRPPKQDPLLFAYMYTRLRR